MMLTEFVTARLDEDEAAARDALRTVGEGAWVVVDLAENGSRGWADVAVEGSGDQYGPDYVTSDRDGIGSTKVPTAEHIARHDPARVLAQVKAHRKIVAQVSDVAWAGYAVRDVVLGHLASIWSDHPDFREKWLA